MSASALFEGPGPLALALRATTLLVLAMGIAFALRSRSAGARHGLWTATFVLLLALPVAYLAIPRWELPVLPVGAGDEPALVAPSRPAGGLAWVVRKASTNPVRPRSVSPQEAGRYRHSRRGSPSPSPSPGRQGQRPGGSSLWLAWGTGAGAALISLLAAHLRFAGVRRRGTPVENPVWLGQLDAVRDRVGVSGHVDLIVSRDASTPMTGGLRRPVIVLPTESLEWTGEQRTVVLTHEMIHVRRRDALRQLVGRAALAAYWFHPLGWFASRQAAISRELACDEGVLSLGTRPSEYAALLLELSRRSPRTAPAVLSLAMVQRSQLERRLMSILDPDRPKRSSILTASAVVALAALGLSVAIAQPVPAAQEAPPAAKAPRAQEAPSPRPVRADLLPEPAAAPAVAVEPVARAETVPEPAPVVPLTALEPLSDARPSPAVLPAPREIGPEPVQEAPPVRPVADLPPVPGRPPASGTVFSGVALIAPAVPTVASIPPQEAGCRMEGVKGELLRPYEHGRRPHPDLGHVQRRSGDPALHR